MVKKLEHLGIAVKSIKDANELYSQLLGVTPYKEEKVESEDVTTSFFNIGNCKIELLEGTSAASPITKFIEKRGEGIHHIAFEVDDIEAEMERLKLAGFILLSDSPRRGADNKVVCFIHPKSANGVLIELVQEVAGS